MPTITPDFDVQVDIHDGVTATILGDLHDHTAGRCIGVPVSDGDDVMDRIVTDSPFVHGDFEVIARSSATRLEVTLSVEGTDWEQMMTRYRTARVWWRQAGSFHVDVTLEGETTRYLARRPDVTSTPVRPIHLANSRRPWLLSFPIQPNPVVI